jgi:hypothetical protein
MRRCAEAPSHWELQRSEGPANRALAVARIPAAQWTKSTT